MRLSKKRPYLRREDGTWVPADNPDSISSVLREGTHRITFEVGDWRLVHRVSGFDPDVEREPFTFREDVAASTRLHCKLANERRNFFSLSEGGLEYIAKDLELDIVPIEGADIEGQIRHWEATDDKAFGGGSPEAFAGTLGIPRERFEWITRHLHDPNVKLYVTIGLRLYREEIALSFDEDWMTQDFGLASESYLKIQSYDLAAVSSGKAAPLIEVPDDEAAGIDREEEALSPPPSPTPEPDHRLTVIAAILAAILALLVFR